ncbi:MAG: FecR domain-containing protein [Marinilabiliaceae bacterium]|nr:FecR domain-containing protein [Marinilabiliaceae bacterium]
MTEQEKIELLITREFNGDITVQEQDMLKQWWQRSENNRELYEKQKRLIQAQLIMISQKRVNERRERTKTGVINNLLKRNRKVKQAVYSSLSILVVGFCITVLFFDQGLNQRDQLLAGTFKIEAPKGQTTSFTLPEGSEVWLNAASELTFGYDMENHTRKASLEGEGYFKIAHDKKRPFIVEGFKHKIKVYGTEFNVISNSQSQQYEVTLHNGSVGILSDADVELARLNPGQQYTTDADGQGMIRQVKDMAAISGWKKERYEFKDATLEEIAKKMSEMYDVEILIVNEKLKKERFRCVLEKHRSVIKTLKIFSLTSNLDYEIKKDVIILKRKDKI